MSSRKPIVAGNWKMNTTIPEGLALLDDMLPLSVPVVSNHTLNSLLLAGYHEEAADWREWLLRAVAGSPADLQTLYSVTGERRAASMSVSMNRM